MFDRIKFVVVITPHDAQVFAVEHFTLFPKGEREKVWEGSHGIADYVAKGIKATNAVVMTAYCKTHKNVAGKTWTDKPFASDLPLIGGPLPDQTDEEEVTVGNALMAATMVREPASFRYLHHQYDQISHAGDCANRHHGECTCIKR